MIVRAKFGTQREVKVWRMSNVRDLIDQVCFQLPPRCQMFKIKMDIFNDREQLLVSLRVTCLTTTMPSLIRTAIIEAEL